MSENPTYAEIYKNKVISDKLKELRFTNGPQASRVTQIASKVKKKGNTPKYINKKRS